MMIKHRKKEGMKEKLWENIYIELRSKTSYEKDHISLQTFREGKMRRKRKNERIKVIVKK